MRKARSSSSCNSTPAIASWASGVASLMLTQAALIEDAEVDREMAEAWIHADPPFDEYEGK